MPRPWPCTPTWTIPWGGGGVAGRRTGPYIYMMYTVHSRLSILSEPRPLYATRISPYRIFLWMDLSMLILAVATLLGQAGVVNPL